MKLCFDFKKLTEERPDGSMIVVFLQDHENPGMITMYPTMGSYSFANEDKLWWAYFPNQPERSKREDLERGCGALNTADNVVRDK